MKPESSRFRRWAWGALAVVTAGVLGLPAVGSQAPVTTSVGNYVIQNWQIEDGLPQSSVLSIGQTPDGHLWLATYSGLVRFDGVRFTVLDTGNLPGMPSDRLVRLHVDRAGCLWVITEYHDLARIEAGHCRQFTEAEGVPAEGAHWVVDDAQGRLWLAGVKAGLWRWETNQFVPVPSPPGFAQWPVRAMMTDAAGRPWFSHRDGLFCYENDCLVPLAGSAGRPGRGASPACPSQDGGWWMFFPEGLRKYSEGDWLPQVWPCPSPKSPVVDMREDVAGNLWVATYDKGLMRFNHEEGWQHLTVESGLQTPNLRSLFCDREGNVWVGTDGGGLLRLRARPWKMITRGDGLGIDAVHSIAQDSAGRIWFGGGTTQPYWLEQGVVRVAIPAPQSDVLDGVWAVLSAGDGAMWIGTYGGNVFSYRDGVLNRYGKAEGMSAGSVRALLEDKRGAIWVGGFDGLSRIAKGEVTHYSRPAGLSSEKVWALAEGKSGCLYIGTAGGGLNVWQNDRFRVCQRADGLPDDHIRALYVDAQDALWIGTRSGGLSRLKEGHFFNFLAKGGLGARSIGPMVEDDQERLWMVSNLGILRVSRHELNEFAAGTRDSVSHAAYDGNEGLATIEVGGIQPACLKARDGTLWFGTAKGAAHVNPMELSVNSLPPPVIIEEVLIDGEPVVEPRPQAGGPMAEHEPLAAAARTATLPLSPVTLLPHQRRVEFRFAGLSFAAPAKVRFRYRMEGFDPGWVDGGRVRNASYTRLPPGRYCFHVTACNDSGVWNETGASLGVSVIPALHQTWWFPLVVLAAVVGLVSSLFGLRLAFLRQLARLRSRIAGDLHDEIGSNLGGIVLLSELSQQTPALPIDVRASLQEINATAQRTASAMRDIVWFLNPDFDTVADMAARMREFTATLLSGCECDFGAPDLASARRLPLEFRRNVFFAYKEILHNIVKHASATRVSIRLTQSGRRLTLHVRDNGRGFDAATVSSGHGLHSLRQRARVLGGQLTLETAPGQGTTIVLTALLT